MSKSTDDNVLDFNKFRDKKKQEENYAWGRKPLVVSHLDGIIKGSPHFMRPDQSDSFSERIQRIKQSLEKINSLMAELKRQPKPEMPSTNTDKPVKE